MACVLMFQLQQDDFPVDTHVSYYSMIVQVVQIGIRHSLCTYFDSMVMQVFEIAKAMAWVPVGADRNKTYLHLNQWIPDELKFDLNCLLYTHGKLCRKCIKKGGSTGKQQEKESEDSNSCPLLRYCK